MNRLNNILIWLLLIGSIGGNVHAHYQFKQIEQQIAGVMYFVALTNEDARVFLSDFIKVSRVKDKETRTLLQDRVVRRYSSEQDPEIIRGTTRGTN